MKLKLFQTRVGQIERNSYKCRSFRREPLISQVARRFQAQPSLLQFFRELCDSRLKFTTFDLHVQITDAQPQKFAVWQGGPSGFNAHAVRALTWLFETIQLRVKRRNGNQSSAPCGNSNSDALPQF